MEYPNRAGSGSGGSGGGGKLIRTANGGIRGCLENAATIMSGVSIPDLSELAEKNPWAGVFGYDEFSLQAFALISPPFEVAASAASYPRPWADIDDIEASRWLQRLGCPVDPKIVAQAVQSVANATRYHPVRDYLDRLVWDGSARLDRWLDLYLGAEDIPLTRAIAAKWMIGAVARIYRPGAKVDCVLILEGPQGAYKSSSLRLLGAPWFTDELSDIGSKDASMQTRGVWIIELSELDSLGRADIAKTKAFLSRSNDRFRPPYGHRLVESPRQCVFAGTTNATNGYLRDDTGGRRFWPVKVGIIDLTALEGARDQLWAEAVERYRLGDTWWLDTPELSAAAAEAVAERYEGDPWEAAILGFIRYRDRVTMADILLECLNIPIDRQSRSDQVRVGNCLTHLHWKKKQRHNGTRYYLPPVRS